MKNARFAPVVLFFGLLLSTQAAVKISGDPTDYVKITNAIGQASSGATILLSTGTYYEVVAITNITLTISGGYNHDCSAKIPGGKSKISAYSITGGRGSVFDIEASTVVLRDLLITDGKPPMVSISSYGGGLDIEDQSTVNVLDCEIYENSAKGYGGGIYLDRSSLTLQDTPVYSNSVTGGGFPTIAGMGGGIAALESALYLTGVSPVVSNRALGCGGGIYVAHSTTTVSHASIYIAHNIASNGAGIYADGGALSVGGGTDIGANTADSLGGGVALVNGARGVFQGSGTIIGDGGDETGRNWVTNGCGGGIAALDSSVILSNSMWVSCNTAEKMGGACYVERSRLTVSESLIGVGTTNIATFGGGIASISSTVDIRHLTYVLNGGALMGGGIFASNTFLSVSTNCGIGWLVPEFANTAWFGGAVFAANSELAIGGMVLNNKAYFAGGGLQLIDCRLYSTGGVFRGNTADAAPNGSGGGILLYGGSAADLLNVQIISNRAWNGAGICTFATGTLYLEGSIVSSNIALGSGGGLYCDTNADIYVVESYFERNQAATNGGGVCMKNGAMMMAYDSSFRLNRAGRHGGAIALDASEAYCFAEDSNVIVSLNQAYEGGGIYADQGSAAYFGGNNHFVFITQNAATNTGGGISYNHSSVGTLLGWTGLGANQANMGGGIFVGSGSQISTLSDGGEPPAIYNNTALDSGGGICASGAFSYVDLKETAVGHGGSAMGNKAKSTNSSHGGGGIAVFDGANLSVSNCWICNNTSDSRGGGILVNSATMQMGSQKTTPATSVQPPNLMENNWATNEAFGLGGAIATVDAIVAIRDVLIHSNTASYGGGIHFSTGSTGDVVNAVIAKNTAQTSADGIRILNASRATLLHTTIVSNHDGIGISVSSSLAILTNCIVRGHSVQEISVAQQVSYSDIEGGYAGAGNIDREPKFFDPAGSDYRLKYSSPCITSGVTLASVTDDAIGMSRPQGPRSGMGAYEYNGNTYDSDLDAMADNWETNYLLNPLSAADAGMDIDSDGYLNREEYFADTDPTIGTRYLHLLDLSNAGTQTVVSFMSSAACAYNLERRDFPSDSGSWTQMVAYIAGTGGRISLTNAEPAGASSIYRIKAWRP